MMDQEKWKQKWGELHINLDENLAGNKAVLTVMGGYLSSLQDENNLPETVSKPSKVLGFCIENILKSKETVDEEYLKYVKNLLKIFPELLSENCQDTIKVAASELLDKIEIFHDLMEDKPAPEQAKSQNKRMLGDYLIELGFVTQEQLDEALAAQKSGNYPGKRVGDILQDREIITRAQLDEAIELQMIDNYES